MTRVIPPCFAALVAWVSLASAAITMTAPVSDEQYIAEFNQHFHKRGTPVGLKDVVSVQLYDSQFMGAKLDEALGPNPANLGGDIAWGLAYRMISLNDMFRLTQDPKYLRANLRFINAVLAVRDDRIGRKDFHGQVAPAWTSDKYSGRGRCVFLVHTGMIVYPMLEAIHLARSSAAVPSETKAQLEKLLPAALESLHYHDRQWRDGPGADEGRYIGEDEEQVLDGRPQPGNRLSAIGRCLWTAWLITRDNQYRSKAVALGWYIKHRLPVGEDGAYYWPYALSEVAVTKSVERAAATGEDLSHATLTVSFPIMLAREHVVFTDEDMGRFAKTVTHGWARLGADGGILFGDVTGNPRSRPDRVVDPAAWLCLAAYDPAVKSHILPFYLTYDRRLRPEEFAQLLAMN